MNNNEADLTLLLESTNNLELVTLDNELDEFAVDSIINSIDINLNIVNINSD